MQPRSRPADRNRGDNVGRRGSVERSTQSRRPDGGSGPLRTTPPRQPAERKARPASSDRRAIRSDAASASRRPNPGATAHPEAHRLTTRTDTANTLLGPRHYTPRRIGLLAFIAIILLVTVSFPLRNHYQFKSEQQAVEQERIALEQAIIELEEEQDKLNDPAYVEQMARIRLGAVMPGETPYRVSYHMPGEDLEREQAEAELAALPWQSRVWRSIAVPQEPVIPEAVGE